MAIYRAANYDQVNGAFGVIADGVYTITPACAPNARLDVAGGNSANWTNIQIYADNGSAAQQWQITDYRGDGKSFVISSKASGKALYCSGRGSGANVTQYEFYAAEGQKWTFKDAGDGYYYIVSCLDSNLCLDVSGGKNANGTNVQVWTANNSAAQKWKLTRVDQTSTQTTTQPTTNQGGHWGPWSAWQNTPVTKTSTRDVGTQQVKVSDGYTEYRYGGYYCYDSRGKIHDCWCETYLKKLYGSATLRYSNWSTTRYSPKTGANTIWSCGSCGGNHIGVSYYSGGKPWWHEYGLPGGNNYYWEETRTVSAQYQTQYRYRDWING